jgi:hypothetical protein
MPATWSVVWVNGIVRACVCVCVCVCDGDGNCERRVEKESKYAMDLAKDKIDD